MGQRWNEGQVCHLEKRLAAISRFLVKVDLIRIQHVQSILDYSLILIQV